MSAAGAARALQRFTRVDQEQRRVHVGIGRRVRRSVGRAIHPTHCTDWFNPLEEGTVVFTHCGSGSFRLAERQSDIVLADVRLMGQGMCAPLPAKTGLVTLLSLVAAPGGYQVALLEGEALPADMVLHGNRVRVQFARPTDELIDWIQDEGIGHHWMIGYGHVGAQVRARARMAGDGLVVAEPG